MKRALWLLLSFFIIGVDAASKYWTHHTLPLMSASYPAYPYGGIGIFENFLGIEFSLTHLTNKGAAWGALGNYQYMLQGFRMALIAALSVYSIKFNKTKSARLPLCLIISGAMGNVIDYFLYGHVVDMLHFVLWGYDFPVFNIADSAVTIGIAMLIILSLWQDQKARACA